MCLVLALLSLKGGTMPLVLVLLPLYNPVTHHGNTPPPPAVTPIPPPPAVTPIPPPTESAQGPTLPPPKSAPQGWQC